MLSKNNEIKKTKLVKKVRWYSAIARNKTKIPKNKFL